MKGAVPQPEEMLSAKRVTSALRRGPESLPNWRQWGAVCPEQVNWHGEILPGTSHGDASTRRERKKSSGERVRGAERRRRHAMSHRGPNTRAWEQGKRGNLTARRRTLPPVNKKNSTRPSGVQKWRITKRASGVFWCIKNTKVELYRGGRKSGSTSKRGKGKELHHAS